MLLIVVGKSNEILDKFYSPNIVTCSTRIAAKYTVDILFASWICSIRRSALIVCVWGCCLARSLDLSGHPCLRSCHASSSAPSVECLMSGLKVKVISRISVATCAIVFQRIFQVPVLASMFWCPSVRIVK